MVTFLTALHVLVCVFLIIVVLLQAGKGGGMGIAFGGGGSQTVFGSSGAGNFLTKLTAVTAFLFLVTSLGLAHYSSQQDSKRLQRLAERKAVEKKVEDARAAKLKDELQRARDAAKSAGTGDLATPPPNSSELPTGTPLFPGQKPGLKLDATKLDAKAKAEKADAAAKTAPAAKAKVKGDADTAKASDGEAAPVAKPSKPKRKRRAAPVDPGADGDKSAPAAPPAEAPAAPAQ